VALEQSYIGRTYPPTSTYEVSREKISEFADAIGDPNPLYRDPEAARAAGYPDVIAPPTFLWVLNIGALEAIAADPDLGVDYTRLVHGDQGFSHTRPAHAGDRLRLTTTITEIMDRAGNDFLTLRAELRTEDDELVCTTRTQVVIRGEAA
jgi:acyl dehydratase